MAEGNGSDGGERSRARAIGIGCLMAVPGFFGGGMIVVAIGRLIESVTGRCTPPEGLPACHTGLYLLVGGLTGLVLLPSVVLWRMHRGPSGTRNSGRS